MIHADASVKNIKYGKHLANIIDNSVITCYEFIDAEAKSYDEETKTVTTNFNEKSVICETKSYLLYFTCLFINYHCVIDSC